MIFANCNFIPCCYFCYGKHLDFLYFLSELIKDSLFFNLKTTIIISILSHVMRVLPSSSKTTFTNVGFSIAVLSSLCALPLFS